MRGLSLVALAMLAVGCAEWDPGITFSGDGVLNAATRGVVLQDNGVDANAGMYGTTCAVDTRTGWVGADTDYPSESEQVQDVGRFDGKDVVVVTTDRGVFLTPTDAFEQETFIPAENVLEARVAGDAVALLIDSPTDGCSVQWDGSAASVDVAETLCVDPDVTADPTYGDVYVGTDDGVYQVGTDDVTRVDADADLAEFDAFTGLLFVANTGDTWVKALDSDGRRLWQTDLGNPVVSLDDLGWQEAVAVLVDAGTLNELYVVDAWTGEATLATETPDGAEQVVTSRNGRDLALITSSQVHFRALERHQRD